MFKRTPIEIRFWKNVLPEPNSGCWLWVGYVDSRGYGRIWLGGREGCSTGAHRLALKLSGAVVPDDKLVLHHCDNPTCVNPDHLFVGTQADNLADMDRKGRRKIGPSRRGVPRPGRCFQSEKTHCKHGHSLADAYRDWRGRICRTCAKMKSAKQRTRNRAGAMSLREQTK